MSVAMECRATWSWGCTTPTSNCCRPHARGTASWCGPSMSDFAGLNRPGCPTWDRNRSAGRSSDRSLGPVDLVHIRFSQQGLPVGAFKGVEEAIARRMGHQLVRLTGNLAIDQYVGTG